MDRNTFEFQSYMQALMYLLMEKGGTVTIPKEAMDNLVGESGGALFKINVRMDKENLTLSIEDVVKMPDGPPEDDDYPFDDIVKEKRPRPTNKSVSDLKEALGIPLKPKEVEPDVKSILDRLMEGVDLSGVELLGTPYNHHAD